MGTGGYFAYRYEKKYYRRYLWYDAYPSGHGQRLANMVPRDPSAFKDWVADRIKMLENAKLDDEEVTHPGVSVDDGEYIGDNLGFNVIRDLEWTFIGGFILWTYVIDLDNLVFTINGTTHLRLDNMPPFLNDRSSGGDDHRSYVGQARIPSQHISTTVDLWPAPNFDTEESQRNYKALRPIIVPANEWGAPTWDDLSVSQQFSIEFTHQLLRKTSGKFIYAYAPFIRSRIGKFCWDVLCASVPALPLFQKDDLSQKGDFSNVDLCRTLSCGFTGFYSLEAYHGMLHLTTGCDLPFGDREAGEYFWFRDRIITFCVRLGDPTYVAYEVEQMVRKMRHGHDEFMESVGIILSSQRELVVVAVDGPIVRHTPVLDIRTTPRGERPGRASDGRLLLTHLLSPPLTTSRLPWRITHPGQLPPVSSGPTMNLPPEILRIIIHQVDMGTYLALCRVSRSIRSVCVANPRVGKYTVLHRVPEFNTVFAARSMDNELKTIYLQWKYTRDVYSSVSEWEWEWELREVEAEELDRLKLKNNVQ
ncbi:unnamed protein product [Rhizoctonia solani]|uniref:F-box domain-containing protein n=1 Tax=Rhizoctonia solani TaxID=456999 RepID=A0A8H3H746_9AGAM|nr:unnamed protein product [Rhizoctonia solani]